MKVELTDKSLKGCIKIPSGSRLLFSKLCVLGIVLSVHLNIL